MDGELWGGGSQDTNSYEQHSGSSSPHPRSQLPFYVYGPLSSVNGLTEKSWSAKTASSVNRFSSKQFWGKLLSKLSAQSLSYTNRLYTSPLHTIRLLKSRYPRASTLLLLMGILILMVLSPIITHGFRSSRHLGGGNKFVIILAANKGGGVMEWKNSKQWAAERESIANKKHYARKWGYHLEVKDMSTKKRYAHEWRESWEKVDVIKQTMRQYPKAEW